MAADIGAGTELVGEPLLNALVGHQIWQAGIEPPVRMPVSGGGANDGRGERQSSRGDPGLHLVQLNRLIEVREDKGPGE